MDGIGTGDPVSFLDVVNGFFRQDLQVLSAYLASSNGDRIAFMIVLTAGISEALGQSVILFANRVPRLRFVISIVVAALFYTAGFFAWTATIVVATGLVLETPLEWQLTARVVALSYVPLFFAFFWLVPYLGNPIIIFLYLWAFGTLTEALIRLTEIGFSTSFLITLIGLLLVLLLRTVIGRPLNSLADRILDVAAGTRVETDLRRALGAQPIHADHTTEQSS